MQLEQALYAYLTGHAGLSALVGTRVYPEYLPDAPTYPAVVYQRVSGLASYTHDSAVGAGDFDRARIQFDCWADTYAGVKAVRAQLIAALSAYRGTMGGVGGVTIGGVFKANELDWPEREAEKRRAIVDFMFLYRE